MPVPTTYAELQTEIADWLARPGVDVTTFIGLAEREIEKKLRTREMVCRARALLNEEYEFLPPGFLDMVDVKIINTDGNGNVTEAALDFQSQSQLTPSSGVLRSVTEEGSPPDRYTIVGEQIRFLPPPGDTGTSTLDFEIHYYGKFTYLADSLDGTNPILTEYPIIYLFGSLMYAAPFYGAGHRKGEWSEQFYGEIDAANKQFEEASYGSMSISMPS